MKLLLCQDYNRLEQPGQHSRPRRLCSAVQGPSSPSRPPTRSHNQHVDYSGAYNRGCLLLYWSRETKKEKKKEKRKNEKEKKEEKKRKERRKNEKKKKEEEEMFNV